MAANPIYNPALHLRQLQNLLKKGYTSQLLFCDQIPPSIKVPALISCKMYDEAAISLLNQQSSSPLQLLWLIACFHMMGANYNQYYEQLKQQDQKYIQLADDWIKMNKPLSHPPEIKSLLRKKFQQLLLLSQQQNYLANPAIPVFLVSCKWLQKMYNDNLPYIPAVDNSDLFERMPWIETQSNCMHYNYALKETCRESVDYKIIPYEAWQFLFNNFGGMEFRRFTTKQKQPICQFTYIKIRIMVAHERHLFGFQIFEILASRFDTIAFIIERIKRIMIAYNLIEFESLKLNWQPIIISHLDTQALIDIIQDEERDLIKEATQDGKNQFELERLQYDHDVEDSEYNYKSDILLFNLEKNGKSFLDMHSIPYKKTTKKYNKCLTCNTTEKLQECICKQAYFCCKECREKNKEHLKICESLRKSESVIDRLIDTYKVNKRKYNFDEIKNGGKVGLENLGNTCYMNAALQCVLSVEVLNKFFCANDHLKELNTSNVLGSGGDLACAYGQLIKDYYTTNRKALEPIKVLKIISSKNSQFRGYNHQDSQQFFNYFFDKLHEDLNRVRDKPYTENIESDGRPDAIISEISWRNYLKRNNSFISDNFAGQYRSQIRCPDCHKISITFDPFLSVTLPFPKIEKPQQMVGYFLSDEGEYIKASKILNGSMNSEQFLNRYFNEPVLPLWLRNKQPFQNWKPKKTISQNNNNKGVLIFYHKPVDSNVEIQVKYQGYEIFHRKIFVKEIESQQQLMGFLYKNVKIPVLKATKNEELSKLANDQYLKKCQQSKFLEVISISQIQYPIKQGILKVKAKIVPEKLPQQWTLKDKIKFDISSKQYEPKQNIKGARRIEDKLTITEMIESFSQPEELTQDNAWYCNKCKQHKLARKIMSIYKTPKYLVLHLKRFNHTGNRFIIYGEKVKTPISLQQQQLINGQKYKLFGVVNHYGSLSMGHYTAFVRREDQWYYADDQSFRRKELSGEEAYLLFYKRIE